VTIAKMKVLFFIRSLEVGGSQRQLVMLADGLAQRGHEVLTVVFYAGREIEGARGQNQNRLITLEKSSRWHVLGPLTRLRRLIVAERPDVIYAFHPMQAVLSALLRPSQLSTRLVFGLRSAGMEEHYYDALTMISYRLEALLSRRADLIIANAHAGRIAAIKRGLPADRIIVIGNGINVDLMRPDPEAGREQRRAWGISDDAFVIGCVARLDPVKDHRNFVAAAAHFSGIAADARFVCVGDGPAAYRAELEAWTRSLGLADRVIWAGEMSRIAAAYNAFDIATLASAFGEGFPNVVGEAMACGTPVVATDVGDIRAIVGPWGDIVPPKVPEQLSAGWQRLRHRLTREPELRSAARQTIVANFSVEMMVRRTEDALLRLVNVSL
jgi:glycosyltransferase involved in cell wall biosynthesis